MPFPSEDELTIDRAVSPPSSVFVRRFDGCASTIVESQQSGSTEVECGVGWGAPEQGSVALEGKMATERGGVVEVEMKVSIYNPDSKVRVFDTLHGVFSSKAKSA